MWRLANCTATALLSWCALLDVKPVLLTDAIKKALNPAYEMGNCDWAEIEQAIVDYAACVWQIGEQAWIVTYANADNEIEILLCGGRGHAEVAGPFEAAMRALPAHKGKTLRLEGRKAWKRVFKNWDCIEKDGGVVLTSRV